MSCRQRDGGNSHSAPAWWQIICLISNAHLNPFPLNQKDLEEISILRKIFRHMHIACCNMHIAKESIMRLTHIQHGGRDDSILSAIKAKSRSKSIIREILAKYYRIAPQNRAELVPSLFQNYYYEFPYTWIFWYWFLYVKCLWASLFHWHICWALKY